MKIFVSGFNKLNEQLQIVDVDGLYLYRKQQSLIQSSGIKVAPMDPPDPPLSRWKEVTDSNVKIIAPKVPLVTSGM